MNILFIHQNFPGQFKHLASFLARDSRHRVVALAQKGAPGLPDVADVLIYTPARRPAETTHHYLRGMESAVLNGQAVAKVLLQLRDAGFKPDLVIAHPGWGEALYVKDIFPGTKLIGYFEFYYHAQGADVDFDPEYPTDLNDRLRIRTRNALHLLNLELCDAGVCPTDWQKSLHPMEFQHRLSVIHEGIDTRYVVPSQAPVFILPNGRALSQKDEVITYVSRNLEPYRGFHTFMRAVEKICERRPDAQIVIAGGDDVSYGKRLADGRTYREKMLQEVHIDPERVHFVGKLPYQDYLKLLQVSSAHIYLTVPFVLSWSMLEAMSAGCLVIGSDTPPVREVIRHGENGLLVDYFSPLQIAEAIDRVFAHPDRMQAIRDQARNSIVRRYEARDSIQAYAGLMRRVIQRGSGESGSEPVFDTHSSAFNIESGFSDDRETHFNQSWESDLTPLNLSAREMEILRQLALGKGDKVIADRLNISTKTVNHHVSSIMQKLDAANRTHAVAKAIMTALIRLRGEDRHQPNLQRRASDKTG